MSIAIGLSMGIAIGFIGAHHGWSVRRNMLVAFVAGCMVQLALDLL